LLVLRPRLKKQLVVQELLRPQALVLVQVPMLVATRVKILVVVLQLRVEAKRKILVVWVGLLERAQSLRMPAAALK
jgi:NhaP-type Na+/H+ and K+/H+ antiporter